MLLNTQSHTAWGLKHNKRLWVQGLLLLLGWLIGTEACAGIFEVAPTDQSKIYLGMIFGGSVGSIQLSGDTNTTLSLMFERFNYIILTVGLLVISYIAVSSTINTAREGQALGQKMSLWVPARACLGTLLMVPSTTSGYSVVQITVLWVVLNGIGAANSVWSVILNQMTRQVGIVASTTATFSTEAPKISGNGLSALVQSVMYSSTCMHSINSMTELPNTSAIYQANKPVQLYVVQQSPNIAARDTHYISVDLRFSPRTQKL